MLCTGPWHVWETGGFNSGSHRVEPKFIQPDHLLSVASRSLTGIPSSKGSLYSCGPSFLGVACSLLTGLSLLF